MTNDNIISRHEILARMGSETSDAEANAMIEILRERGVCTMGDISGMSDEAFFGLIPEAIARANGRKNNKPKTYSVDGFTTPPANHGQMVTVSYGVDPDAEVIVQRRHDASTGAVGYVAFEMPDTPYEPWSCAPVLGKCLGACLVRSHE